MIIFIIGKSASGKDTFANYLWNHTTGMELISTCTTRPKRDGESQGNPYYFLSEEDFTTRLNNNEFAETRAYRTEFGTWRYGTLKSSLISDDDLVMPCSLEQYITIKECISESEFKDITYEHVLPVYLSSSLDIRLQRAIQRSDKSESQLAEICRRMYNDEHDFSELKLLSDGGITRANIIYNSNMTVEETFNVFKQRFGMILNIH